MAFYLIIISISALNFMCFSYQNLINATNDTTSNFSAPNLNLTTEIWLDNESNVEVDNHSTSKVPTTPVTWSDELSSHSMSKLPCVCDLLEDECDVNCCCDQSCSKEDVSVFTDCGTSMPPPKLQYCFQEDFIYTNNTPYKMTKVSANMFCIYTDNNQEQLNYEEFPPITERRDFESVVNEHRHFKWIEPALNQELELTLKVGSPVKIITNDGGSDFLSLLDGFVTSTCSAKSPIRFLVDSQKDCHHRIMELNDCAQNIYLNAHYYYKNFSIGNNYANDSENAVPIQAQLCTRVLGSDIIRCEVPEDEIPSPRINISGKSCEFVVSEVSYRLFYNGSVGVVSAFVDLTLANVTLTDKSTKWHQKHKVQFKKMNENVNFSNEDSFRLSGNPGYRLGAPIMAGRVKHLTDGAVIHVTKDPTKWLTVVKGPTCNKINRLSITFQNDIKSGCFFQISFGNVSDETCALLQTTILDLLNDWNAPEVVAAYGNSPTDDPKQWIPIVSDNKPPPAHLVDETACSNIVQNLQIVILYAKTGSMRLPQPKIVGVKFSYDVSDTVQSQCEDQSCDFMLHVESSVEFLDISRPAVAAFLDPPTIHLELPADFFYPFTSGTSSGAIYNIFYATIVFHFTYLFLI